MNPQPEQPEIWWYQYFGVNPNGGVQPVFQLYCSPDPNVEAWRPPKELLDQMYALAVKQHGLGVPRPTHVCATLLEPLPEQTSVLVPPHTNGVDPLSLT